MAVVNTIIVTVTRATAAQTVVINRGPTGPAGPPGDGGGELTSYVTQVAALGDYPATFPPATHTHAQSEVTNLVTDLAAKAPNADPTFTGTVSAAAITASGTVKGANFREGAQYPVTIGVTYSPTITTGSVITATLLSSTPCVITLPDPVSGQSFMIHLQQPSIGAPTTASWVGVDWGDAGEPTITPTLGKMDILSFVSNQAGTKWFGSYIQGFTY